MAIVDTSKRISELELWASTQSFEQSNKESKFYQCSCEARPIWRDVRNGLKREPQIYRRRKRI